LNRWITNPDGTDCAHWSWNPSKSSSRWVIVCARSIWGMPTELAFSPDRRGETYEASAVRRWFRDPDDGFVPGQAYHPHEIFACLAAREKGLPPKIRRMFVETAVRSGLLSHAHHP
jgi:hypothetical protein